MEQVLSNADLFGGSLFNRDLLSFDNVILTQNFVQSFYFLEDDESETSENWGKIIKFWMPIYYCWI